MLFCSIYTKKANTMTEHWERKNGQKSYESHAILSENVKIVYALI